MKTEKVPGRTSIAPFVFALPVLIAITLEGGGVVPVTKVFRNILFPARPGDLVPAYEECSNDMMSKDMTIVVSVKDACSQATDAELADGRTSDERHEAAYHQDGDAREANRLCHSTL